MHKNSQKRKFENYSTYFVTTNTKNRYPYFQHDLLCELFIEELKLCKKIKKFNLYGFVILPDHVHLLLQPFGDNLSETMRSLKSNFSRDLNQLTEGAVPEPRLLGLQHSRRSMRTFNILQLKNFHDIDNLNLPKFQWQKSFHDHYIRNQKDFKNHLNYINSNHLKHNLNSDYKYVGYNYFELLDL